MKARQVEVVVVGGGRKGFCDLRGGEKYVELLVMVVIIYREL